MSCHSRSVHPKNFFMKKHKEIQYPVCTAVFDLNLLLQYVALTAWGHLHPTYICANKCPFAFGFPYDLSLLPHSASRPPQIGWWWIGKKKKKLFICSFTKRGGMATQRGRYRRPQWASTKAAITHHGTKCCIVPAFVLGCYNKTTKGHNAPIHHQYMATRFVRNENV